MEIWSLSRRALASLWAGVVWLLLIASPSWAAGSGTSSLESPAVRQSIASQIAQAPGPVVVTQGGQGGTGEPAPPAGGELVPSLSTANSDTWRVPGRPKVSRIYASPVNYKGSDGAWHPISSQLVPSALGGYHNEANSFALQVPMSLSSGVSLSSAGHTVSFALEGAREALPTVSGDRATYTEALASTNFEYLSSSTGVKETATLENQSAPSELRFTLSASPGLRAIKAQNGTIELADPQGKIWFRIPAPLARPSSAGHGVGRALPSTLSLSGSGWVLSIDTGTSWLRSALASGPVVVDPSIEESGSQNCTIESDVPTESECSGETFEVGYHSESPAHEHHGLLKFNLSSLPGDVVIEHAKLGLYLASESTTNSKAVGVYRVEKPWTTSASWEKYDGTHAWATAGGDYSNPPENSDASVNPSVGGSTGWVYWYPTKMVQAWSNGPNSPKQGETTQGVANEGLIVKDEKDNTVNNTLEFDSINASSHKPFLEVAYEPRGVGAQPEFTMLNTQLTDKLTMGVNVASGNLMLQSNALHIAGRGPSFNSDLQYSNVDPEVHDYGRWTDSGDVQLYEQPEGSVEFEDKGAYFVFIKQANGTFITPPGIKATLCTTGKAPCETLPENVKWRLIYNQSQEQIDFSKWGYVVKNSDRYKNALTPGYTEGINQITSWTDTQGRKIEYTRKSGERSFNEVKDVSGSRHVSYEYEGSGSSNQLIAYTDANGHTTHYVYEHYDLTKITTPKGSVIKLAYYSTHQIKEIIRTTDSEHTTGPTTKFAYNKVGENSACEPKQKATVVKDPAWEAEKAHETTYCANVLDQVEETVNAKGKATKGSFDPFGNQIASTATPRETGAEAGVTSLVYGQSGQNLECEVQGKKELTKCPKEALKEGYSTEAEYEDTAFKYQPSRAISARQKKTNLCYWTGSNPCTGESATGATGGSGALRRLTDARSTQNSLNYSYNSDGTVSFSTDPDGHKTSYEYDASGNLKTIIPPSGSGIYKKTITVDAISRPHVITQCLAESGGSCTSSETATLTYDSLDRVTEAVDTGPGATKTFKYTYYADGNLEKREDPAGTMKFTVDPLNRVTQEEFPSGAINEYGYDKESNLTAFTDGGGTTSYIYDGLNQLEAMYEPGGNCGETPVKCTRASYDADGSLTTATYPSKATLNYKVDPTTGRPTSITAKGPSGETLLSHSYSYLEGTNDTPLIQQDIYSQGTTTNTTAYKYEVLDRLEEATTTGTNESHYAYELDGAGNRTKQQVNPTSSTGGTETFYKYNAGGKFECRMKTNEPCSKSSTSELSEYFYNGAGSETSITGYNDPASTSFSYNNLDQLTGLTPPSSSEQSLGYLGSGQNLLRTIGSIGLYNSALGVTKQVNGSGTSYYARTASGIMLDERLPGSTSYNPVYDSQGDVIGLLNSSGALVQTVRYGPYGENASASGSLAYNATDDPFLFQGGYHLAGGNAGAGNVSNNLYHYGARYYDPTTGRWTQPDPLGSSVDYTFVGDNPTNEVDPSGNCSGGCHLTPAQEKCLKKVTPEWGKSQAAKCLPPKNGTLPPVGKCIAGAAVAVLVSGIPGVDITAGEAAAAGCGAALGDLPLHA